MPREIAQARIDARSEAERIVAQARAQAEAIRARARDAGQHAGHAAGLEAGHAQAASSLVDLVAAHARALAALEPQTREIALLAAKHLVASELTLRPELITRTVQDLLERLRRARRVVVRVHPDDCAALSTWMQAREASQSDEASHAAGVHKPLFELQPDEALARGGCVVQSDIGTLDASIETRLAALQKALERT